MKLKIEIVYEDDSLLIVNKPAEVLTIPDRFDTTKPNVIGLLSEHYADKIWVVHRLDRETSGIICFAKTEEAHKNLSQQFFNRTVDKIYLALVDGKPNPDANTIDAPIGPHPTLPGKMTVIRTGKSSVTDYKVTEVFKAFSLVEANIRTGRTHQVRVHFKHIGHPLAVDPLYGKREAFFLSEVKYRKYQLGKDQEERPLMSRTTLHAYQLSLAHPVTGERMTFTNPLPKDFQAVLNQLRKWGT